MSIAKLTSKGQTTIPLAIRSYLGIHTGDKLEFLIDDDGRVIVEPLTSEVSELKGFLPKPKKTVTLEQMNKAIAKRGSRANEGD